MASGKYEPKPPPILPAQMYEPIATIAQPAVTVSKTVTRRGPEPSTTAAHRDHARERAIEVFDEMFDELLFVARDRNGSPQARMAALKLVLQLGLDHSEAELQTETVTSHLDALQGLAYAPPKKLPPV